MRQFLDIIRENLEGEVRYFVEWTGSSHGQKDGYVQAMMDKTPVGYIDFSLFDGVLKIKMIEVSPEYRRQGVGRRMFELLKAEAPHDEIDYGYQTEDGAAFRKAVHEEVSYANWPER